MKLDAQRREYDIIVIGEEAHLAYNRVGLTSFFEHRNVEDLYLNPQEWVSARVGVIEYHDQLTASSTHHSRTGLSIIISTPELPKLTLLARQSRLQLDKRSFMTS